jgi:hypothetical protein
LGRPKGSDFDSTTTPQPFTDAAGPAKIHLKPKRSQERFNNMHASILNNH